MSRQAPEAAWPTELAAPIEGRGADEATGSIPTQGPSGLHVSSPLKLACFSISSASGSGLTLVDLKCVSHNGLDALHNPFARNEGDTG